MLNLSIFPGGLIEAPPMGGMWGGGTAPLLRPLPSGEEFGEGAQSPVGRGLGRGRSAPPQKIFQFLISKW